MRQFLAVALGGSIGAALRFLLITLAAPLDEWALHAGALTANLAGCLLIGFLFIWAEHFSIRRDLNALIFTGILGSLTTFSTYGLVTANLLLADQLAAGIGYAAISNGGGLACAYGGILAGRRVFSREVLS